MIYGSPLRWNGAKSRYVDYLRTFLPLDWHHFVEPYGGGASMLLSLARDYPDRRFSLSDADDKLINFWLVLRDHCPDLIQQLLTLHAKHGRKDPELVEGARYTQWSLDRVQRAAAFYVVNKLVLHGHGPGGLGRRTVAKGAHGISTWAIHQLQEYSQILQSVDIQCQRFEDLAIDDDALLFCDPPYEEKGEDLYQHGTVDLNQLADRVRGLRALITLNDSPENRKRFGWAQCRSWTPRYDHSGRIGRELIIATWADVNEAVGQAA